MEPCGYMTQWQWVAARGTTYLLFTFRFASRAATAFNARSRRSAAVILAAAALPPFDPNRL